MGTSLNSCGTLVIDAITGDISTIITVAYKSDCDHYFQGTIIDVTMVNSRISLAIDLWYKVSAITVLCVP